MRLESLHSTCHAERTHLGEALAPRGQAIFQKTITEDCFWNARSGRASLSTDVCILLTDNKLSRRMEPWGQTLGCVTWGLEGYLIEKWLQTPAESEVSHHCQMCQPTLPSKSQTWCCSLWATRLKPGKVMGVLRASRRG